MAQRDGWRQAGLSVRLVHDTVVPFTPEYVDLGLSVLWATTNVGARYPEGYGDYFAWGETEPKEAYSWDTYKWCNSADTSITKYNNADGMTTLLPEDDAATVNWGGKWRTPTKEELAELRLSCTWEWTTLNGINGHQVTGPNGNSIFIPAGGSYNQFNHEISGVGIQGWFYASDRGAARQANEIGTPAKGPYSGSCSRCCGLTIRPVCEKDSNIVTVIIDPTPANSNVGLYSRYEGSVKVTRSIRVEKGNDVLYQVSNTENGYLSQGDTLYKVMRDTVLKVSLKPFTEGNWETVDLTGLTRYDNYYISRNRGIFAGPYSNWCYYVMPVNSGETYRVSSRAGQLAALWFIASTPPDYENKIPPTKVNCSKNGGIVGYIAEEFTVPEGGNYLIINASPNKTPVVEHLVVECCTFTQEEWDAAVNLWGHGGRAHTPADQSCIQGTYVNGVRLKIGRVGSLNVYKVPTLLETTEDNFELVATLTTDSTGVQDFDFDQPIYIAPNEYLVFGKPSAKTPTLLPCYINNTVDDSFPDAIKGLTHRIGSEKVASSSKNASLMVEFY